MYYIRTFPGQGSPWATSSCFSILFEHPFPSSGYLLGLPAHFSLRSALNEPRLIKGSYRKKKKGRYCFLFFTLLIFMIAKQDTPVFLCTFEYSFLLWSLYAIDRDLSSTFFSDGLFFYSGAPYWYMNPKLTHVHDSSQFLNSKPVFYIQVAVFLVVACFL